MKVGVLAVQGNFREHAAMLRRLGADVVEHEPLRGRASSAPAGHARPGWTSRVLAELHPELTDDTRVHERFLELVREETNVRA